MLSPLLATAQLNGGTITPINGVSSAPSSFATIQEAATYLAANGVAGTGDVILEITAAYTAAGEPGTGIVLDSIPNTTASRRVIFRPAPSTNVTVSLNVAGNATLNLQRVNFVTFDGRAGGAGTVKRLTITNTSTSGTSFTGALKLINSSKNNIFQFCTFNGSAALATSSTVFGNGVIQFGDASTFSQGNNGNKIYRCDVNGNSSALQLLVSRGSTTSPSVANFRDTVRSCNFFDNFSNLAGNIAINLHQGNDEWVLDSNSVYQTVARTYTVQALHTGINTVLAYTGEMHTINANYVGGSAAGASGMMTLQGATTNAVGFIGISCQHGEGSLVTNNTIRNITLTYAASAGTFGNAAISVNMQYTSGLTNVGNNNINNISYSNTNGFIRFRAVYLRAVVTATTGTFGNVQPQLFAFSNVLNNITATGSGATGSSELAGFACESASANNLLGGTCIGNFFIYDNKITQLSATSATPSTGTIIRGIFSFTTQGSSSASGLANYNEIIKDTIAGLSTNSSSTAVAPGAATAIFINSGLIDTSLIQQCDISNIANTNAADISNAVCGIFAINGSWDISQNRIYDLKNAATGATLRPNIFGVNVRNAFATSNVHNNQISIGSGQNNNLQVYGIINNFSTSAALRVLYNSVLIGGSPTSGAANSSAIYRGSDTPSAVLPIVTPFLSQNNLCINTRSGGTGIHSAIYNQATAASNGFTSDFNTLVSANTAQAGQWGPAAQTFAAWKTSVAGDVYSYYAQSNASSNLGASTAQVNLGNLFYSATYASDGNLGIDSTKAECWLVAGKGKSVPTINTSFNRTIDPAYPPCIGSFEFTPDVDAPCSFESAAPSLGGTTTYSFAGRNIMSLAWGNTGTVPSTVCVKYYSGKDFTPVVPATSYSASYWGVTAANGSGYTYSPTINFSSSERGTVAFADPSVKQSFFNGSGWTYLGPGSTAVTATNPATSTSTGVAYQLGASTALILTDAASPIPVELMNFTAQRNGGVNLLQWSTAQEINSRWFIVERSNDGSNFTAIGQVAASGNSSSTKYYSFTDNAPVKGINHYRLRMIDKDNGFNLSWIRRVRNEGLADVAVYPNPVLDKFTVNVQADRAINGQLLIMDVSGKLLQSRNVNLVQGENLLPVNAAGLQKGTYIVKMLLEEDVVVRKFNKL